MQEFGPSHSDHQRVPWPEKWQSEPSMLLPSWAIRSLSNNLPLSSDDRIRVDELRQFISRQIKEKEAAIKQLHNDIERLKKESFACDVITTPFRSLPHDILHHVATVCPLIHPASAQYSSPKSHIPSVLTQVSKSWRTSVEGNCSAWQNMRFDCRIWNGKALDLPLARIERFGRLSGTLPIALQLDEKDPDEDDDYQDGFPRILRWVLSQWDYRSRLNNLTIFSPSPYLLSNNLDHQTNTTTSLPPIESLRLLTWEGEYETGWLSGGKDLTRYLEAWPTLRRLWVGGHFGGNTFARRSTAHNPWRQVKALYIRAELERDEWLACFQNCPELEIAWLHIGGLGSKLFPSSTPTSLPSKTIIHQQLTELHFGLSDYGDHILEFFVGLRFPVLENLHLHFYFADPSTGPGYQAKDFVDVFPALKHLAIHETGTCRLSETIGGLFPLLMAVPSTTSLWTSISHKHILEFLEFFRGKRFPLPNLQSYTLQFVVEQDIAWLSPQQERNLTDALILTRQKRPAVLPSSSLESTASGSAKKKTIHAGLAVMNIIFLQFHQGEETEEDFGAYMVMDDYFTNLQEKFVKQNIDIKVELDWVDDSESLMWHEDRAEREFMKRFGL